MRHAADDSLPAFVHQREMRDMKELVAELSLENRLLKKSMIGDGGDEE